MAGRVAASLGDVHGGGAEAVERAHGQAQQRVDRRRHLVGESGRAGNSKESERPPAPGSAITQVVAGATENVPTTTTSSSGKPLFWMVAKTGWYWAWRTFSDVQRAVRGGGRAGEVAGLAEDERVGGGGRLQRNRRLRLDAARAAAQRVEEEAARAPGGGSAGVPGVAVRLPPVAPRRVRGGERGKLPGRPVPARRTRRSCSCPAPARRCTGTIDAMSMSGAAEVTSFGPFTVSVATGKPRESTWSGGNPPCCAK